ncbi:NPIPA1 isoform 6 [Pan troglodytes]|uniref:NPIPA1 isoform 6 n=1 Tax=Pan troglodytes TaxID=9598 RepID=A0A2J8IJM7_PANTR|nr:NPIPA1 isoform 6 [Pan troglodytes]
MRVRWLLFWLLFWLLLAFISHQSTCVSGRVLWLLFRLLFWLLLGFISHQSTCVINTLADLRHRGTDFGGSLWLLIITVFREVINLPSPSHKLPFCVFPEDYLPLKMDMMDPRMYSREPGGPTAVDRKEDRQKHLRKLSMKEREHAEKERQLSEAEENGKLDMKEIHTYKKMFQRAQVAAAGRGLLQMQNPPFCKKASLQLGQNGGSGASSFFRIALPALPHS